MTPRFVVPVRDLTRALTTDHRFAPHITAHRPLPASPARYGPWPEGLDPELRAAAATLGIDPLYSHQATAVAAALAGRHVALVAGTAAGKSVGYLLPILNTLLLRPEARALLIFPTKALAQDQLEALARWAAALPGSDLRPATYDGDTPRGSRSAVRRSARIVITNPDMLHTGILPHHTSWAPFFAGLTDVVVDEMHVYRGVFGSHVANVLRRLRRIARFHGGGPVTGKVAGTDAGRGTGSGSGPGRGFDTGIDLGTNSGPRFSLTSATIANPGELGRALAGAPVEVIADDGAPRGARTFTIYNPPIVDPRLNLRRAAILEAEALARHFLAGGVQTIVFAHTRQRVELLVRYLGEERGEPSASMDRAAGRPPPLALSPKTTGGGGEARWPGSIGPVRGYRGGYTREERRGIEAALRDGELRGVVATNALELGIDIGALDACVIAGYPGSIASTWQQAGRAGRRAGDAAAVLVAGASPLDQFIARHPDYFFGRSPEHARLDPDNLLILLDHVRCAAFELPFDAAEAARPFGSADTASPGAEDLLKSSPAEESVWPEGADSSASSAYVESSEAVDATTDLSTGGAPLPAGTTDPTPVGELLTVLAAQGVLQHVGGTWYWMADAYPAADVGLRSAGPGAIAVVVGIGAAGGEILGGTIDAGGVSDVGEGADDDRVGRDAGAYGAAGGAGAAESVGMGDGAVRYDVLGTVEATSASVMVHPGAVYLHDGRAFQVTTLDLEAGRAVVVPADGSIYTRASSRTDLRPLRVLAEREAPGVQVSHGELEVRTRATGYRRLRFRTHETVGWGEIDLPERAHVAGGYWFTLDDETVERLRAIGRWHFDPLADRGPNWREQATRARERDGFACRMCAAPEREGRAHDVHHIRPFRQFGWVKGQNDRYREANALDNLITLCSSCHRIAERALGLHGGMSGVGYALSHIAPLFLMCDSRDLGVTAESHAPWTRRPTVAIYERAAAGVGFGAALFALHNRLIAAGAALIADCPCPAGCPACVGPAGEGGGEAKVHALAVLRAVGG